MRYRLRYPLCHRSGERQRDEHRGIARAFPDRGIVTLGGVNWTYTHYDRMAVGGAMPAGKALDLEASSPRAPSISSIAAR